MNLLALAQAMSLSRMSKPTWAISRGGVSHPALCLDREGLII